MMTRFGMELLVVVARLATYALSNKNEAHQNEPQMGYSKSGPKVVQKYSME